MKRKLRLLALFIAASVFLTSCSSTGSSDSSLTEKILSATDGITSAVKEFCQGMPWAAEPEGKVPVTIVYTNDIHCQIEGDLGYRSVALVREALSAAGEQVLLVDSGDHIQGDLIGSLNQGESIIELMNTAEYDVACIGNHEFDYSIERQKELVDMADYPYVCCNFADKDGKLLYEPYQMFTFGDTKVAIIGILTPETIQSANPKYFVNTAGEMVYDLYGDETGDRLVKQVQKFVDEARAKGADYVIALAHLGVNESTSPFTSKELIPRLSGIDAVLDGHSHTVMEREELKDKDGKTVLLTQTGTKLQNIGILRLGEDGVITNRLINNDDISETIKTEAGELNAATSQVVARSEAALVIYDPEEKDEEGNPVRLIRRRETNLGDLCADSLRWAGQSDIGVINGGNIRADLPAGDITIGGMAKVQPFANMISVVEMDGAAILDMLEYSVRNAPDESGGFLQVSGITFDVDLTVKNTVETDGESLKITGDRKIRNVMVGGEPLDQNKKYTVTGNDFILLSGGDGYAFLPSGSKAIRKSFSIDIDCTIDYLQNGLNGTVGTEYADPYGQGRIRMITGSDEKDKN